MTIQLKNALLLGLIFLFSSITYAQISFGKNGTFTNKWYEGDLVLQSGDTLQGLIKYESAVKALAGLGSKRNRIFYKKTEAAKKKKYKYEEFNSFIVTKNDGEIEKYATVFTSKRHMQLLKVLAEGKVSVYEIMLQVNNYHPNSHTGHANVPISYSYANMYIKREHEKIASKDFFKNIFRSFKKTAKRYFSDCPDLVNKIDNGDFKKKRLLEIVDYYNTTCN